MSDIPSTFLQLFNTYRVNLGYGFIAALLCALRGWHDGKAVKQYAFDATVCCLLAGGAEQLLSIFNLPTKWGYFAAIFIGVFGWQVIVAVLKSRVPTITEAKK